MSIVYDPINHEPIEKGKAYSCVDGLYFQSAQTQQVYYQSLDKGLEVKIVAGKGMLVPIQSSTVWELKDQNIRKPVTETVNMDKPGDYSCVVEALDLHKSLTHKTVTAKVDVENLQKVKLVSGSHELSANKLMFEEKFSLSRDDVPAKMKIEFIKQSRVGFLNSAPVKATLKMTAIPKIRLDLIENRKLSEQIKKPGEFIVELVKGTSGVGMTLVYDKTRQGVVVNKLTPNGAATRAGLNPGDMIMAIQGQRVQGLKYGKHIKMLRNVPLTVVLVMTKAPANYVAVTTTGTVKKVRDKAANRPPPPPVPTDGRAVRAATVAAGTQSRHSLPPSIPKRRTPPEAPTDHRVSVRQPEGSAPPPIPVRRSVPRPESQSTDNAPPPPVRSSHAPPPPARSKQAPPPPSRTDQAPPPPARSSQAPPPPARTNQAPPTPERTGVAPPLPARQNSPPKQPAPVPARTTAPPPPQRQEAAPKQPVPVPARTTAPPPPQRQEAAPKQPAPVPARTAAPPPPQRQETAPKQPVPARAAAPPPPSRAAAPPPPAKKQAPPPPVSRTQAPPPPAAVAAAATVQRTEAPPAPAPAAASDFGPQYEKYVRMRKAGLPEGAILNAFNRDSVTPPPGFFGDDLAAPPKAKPTPVATKPTPAAAQPATETPPPRPAAGGLLGEIAGFNKNKLQHHDEAESAKPAPAAAPGNPLLAGIQGFNKNKLKKASEAPKPPPPAEESNGLLAGLKNFDKTRLRSASTPVKQSEAAKRQSMAADSGGFQNAFANAIEQRRGFIEGSDDEDSDCASDDEWEL